MPHGNDHPPGRRKRVISGGCQDFIETRTQHLSQGVFTVAGEHVIEVRLDGGGQSAVIPPPTVPGCPTPRRASAAIARMSLVSSR